MINQNQKDKQGWKESISRLLGIYPKNRKEFIKLLSSLQKSHHFCTSREIQIIVDVLRIREWKIRDVMTHYSDTDTVNKTDDFATVIEKICESEHSRYPVICKKNGEIEVLGILLAKDLLSYIKDPASFSVAKVMRQATFEPDSKTLDALLEVFLETKNHMIIVLNEFTKPAGIITIEDLLEKIVGEIEDESDSDEDRPFILLNDGSYRIKGTLSLEEFNQEFKAQITHDEANSMAELIAATIEDFPQKGMICEIDAFCFCIENVEKRGIMSVIVTSKPQSTRDAIE